MLGERLRHTGKWGDSFLAVSCSLSCAEEGAGDESDDTGVGSSAVAERSIGLSGVECARSVFVR